ncbi:hypothetical protein EB796_015625 [Bugula neritina]|uniref:Uncharacterized protein n=1 Tax=Bugula neritina TaxID=10212 RepID=A0A7J7JIY5_BUGNE|nr:hypothetical protein EB796_015625 [Bugula neritina]
MLSNSFSRFKHVCDTQLQNGCYEYTIDGTVIAKVAEQKAVSAVSALSSNKTRLKKVAALLAQKVLDYLIPRAWIVLRKDLSMANDGELPAG